MRLSRERGEFRLRTAPQPFFLLTHILRDSLNRFRVKIYDFNAETVGLVVNNDSGKTRSNRWVLQFTQRNKYGQIFRCGVQYVVTQKLDGRELVVPVFRRRSHKVLYILEVLPLFYQGLQDFCRKTSFFPGVLVTSNNYGLTRFWLGLTQQG